MLFTFPQGKDLSIHWHYVTQQIHTVCTLKFLLNYTLKYYKEGKNIEVGFFTWSFEQLANKEPDCEMEAILKTH